MRREYLDGLRGWASLFVVFSHLGPMFLLSTVKLPVIPFFSDGLLAVYIFFVLSGYVLSVGYFETNNKSLLAALAIRRYPRLTIPILASCTIAFAMVKLGAMVNIPAGAMAKSPWLESFYTFSASWQSLLAFSFVDVYVDSKAPTYNAVLWTMQYEFWGSLILLTVLFALPTRPARLIGYATATVICWYFSSPLFAFVMGVALAEMMPTIRRAQESRRKLSNTSAIALLATGLLAAALRQQTDMWSPLWLTAFATCVLLAVLLHGSLQRLLSAQISLALGHLSFPLYLTHLLVICSWSSWLFTTLTELHLSQGLVAVVVAASTLAIAMLAAFCFVPVEAKAIRVSRTVSDVLLRRAAPTKPQH